MDRFTLVIAGNRQECDDWCRQHGINPRKVIYTRRPESLDGLCSDRADIVLCGEWWRNPVVSSLRFEWLVSGLCMTLPLAPEDSQSSRILYGDGGPPPRGIVNA